MFAGLVIPGNHSKTSDSKPSPEIQNVTDRRVQCGTNRACEPRQWQAHKPLTKLPGMNHHGIRTRRSPVFLVTAPPKWCPSRPHLCQATTIRKAGSSHVGSSPIVPLHQTRHPHLKYCSPSIQRSVNSREPKMPSPLAKGKSPKCD